VQQQFDGAIDHSNVLDMDGRPELSSSNSFVEPALQQFDGAKDHSNVLDMNGNPDLSNSNSFAAVVDAFDGGDDKAAVTDLLPEDTGSTHPSTPTAVSPEPLVVAPLQVHGAGNEAGVVLANCLPPPITYARTVHAPVAVSAEEFARALCGAVAAPSVELADADQIPHSQENTENGTVKPVEQVKIKTKRRGCC